MDSSLTKWLLSLIALFVFILFLVSFSINSTAIAKTNSKIDSEIKYLTSKVDSLENKLNSKKDTLIINPLKLEIYDCRKR
jgi:peptidoglycan hydrolase CwlO-like protein